MRQAGSLRLLLGGGVALLLFSALVVAGLPSFSTRTEAAHEDRIVAIEGSVRLEGGDAIVELLVLVRPGEDPQARAREALRDLYPEAVEIEDGSAEGAPDGLRSDAFTTTGLVWDALPVTVNYNAGGAPSGLDDLGALLAAMQTWTDVSTSSFAYTYGGTTTRCPSLFDGCPGPQVFDGNNDVGWDDIPTSGVLGVTWSSSSIDEFDIVIDNADWTWYTGPVPVASGTFDLQTVHLHELGHAAGIGHSSVAQAVMAPSVAAGAAKRVLHQDDIDAISFLYPAAAPTATATATPTATGTATATPTPSATATATPDTGGPSTSITAPSDGATVSGAVLFSAEASDSSGVHKVRFWAGGSYLGFDDAAPYSKTWDTTVVGNGGYVLTVEALDWAGNSTFEAITVTVDNPLDVTPPSATISAPASGATVSGTVAFNADATDAGGVQKVRFWVDSSYLGFDTTAPYEKSWDTTGFSGGGHTLTVEALDWAGNATFEAIGVTVEDVTEPAAAITSPLDGATVSGTVAFSAAASDASGIHKVRFWVASTYLSFDMTAPYSKTWNTTAFANGAYTLTIEALDWAGNSTFRTINVTVDNPLDATPPSTAITSPGEGATVSGTVVFNADATDGGGVQKVRFWVDGAYLGFDTAAPYSKGWDTTAFANGARALSIEALDWAGNSTFAAVSVTVDNAPDVTPPSASITSPGDGATVVGTVALSADATDGGGIHKVRFWVDGAYLGFDTSAPYEKSWDTTAFADGQHLLKIQALDWADNSTFETISVVVSNGAPLVAARAGRAWTYRADCTDVAGGRARPSRAVALAWEFVRARGLASSRPAARLACR